MKEEILMKFVPTFVSNYFFKRKNLNIGISSHKTFFDQTFSVCVGSLIASGFNPNNIYIFIGGYEGAYEKINVDYGIHAFRCPHNSFDFTSLVSIIELDMVKLNWFLIHDTTQFDGDFKKKLSRAIFFRKKKLHVWPSMSIGCYDDRAFVLAISRLEEIKNLTKEDCVNREDIFIKHLPCICKTVENLGPSDVYGTGVMRHVEYYEAAGLKKNKANKDMNESWITDV